MNMTPRSTTETFRLLVDKAHQLSALESEAEVIDRFSPQFSGIQPAQRWEALHAAIRTAVCIPLMGEDAFTMLRRLRRSIVYEEALGRPVVPYVAVLRRLADACREGSARPFDDEQAWLNAIQAARALRVLNGDLPEINERETIVVAAAKRFISRGGELRVERGRYIIDHAELNRVGSALDSKVATIGGLVVVEQVIAHLVANEPLQFGRYAPGRILEFGRSFPSFPYGYLLQLGVKHLSSPPALASRLPRLWPELAQQAIDICAILDVEPYDKFENNVALNASDAPQYLADIALFDHLFALKQWPPDRAVDLLRGITASLDVNIVKSLMGWSLEDVFTLMNAVLSLSKKPLTIITPRQLEQVGVSRAAWDALKVTFTHQLQDVNKNYKTPLDADKAEFDFKPLFALPRNHLFVVTPGLACLGFYEAATRALRAADYPNLDTLLGDAVELVVADALRAAGLNVSVQGIEYVAKGGSRAKPTGECDIVVETNELVVFIELKKKPLRRISATGDATPGLVDLSTSLFAAQAQLARHEQVLLRDRELAFVNGYTLKLGERRIERIAMTWLDYGGLQDKYLLNQVFSVLMGKRLTSAHPREGKKLSGLNDAIEALEAEVRELQGLGKNERILFMNCWFISVPQLLMLMEGIRNPDDFVKRLSKLRNMRFGTLDFYRDLGFALRMGLV